MRPVTLGEFSRMKIAQVWTLGDECQILRNVEIGRDEYNMPIFSLQVVQITACGYSPSTSNETISSEAPIQSAELRLASLTDVRNDDSIVLTKRSGIVIDPIELDVEGPPLEGPSGIVVPVKVSLKGTI